MAPKKGGKRAIEDEVFSSKPMLRQKKFQPRLKAVKAMDTTERPRKRLKNQTTMTQLDFGKRSYLEAICDSDDEDEEVKSEDEGLPSTARKRAGDRRNRLPAKTESQDTLTQFVKRSSDVSMMVISDSEDEGEEDVSDAEAEAGEEQAPVDDNAEYEDLQAILQRENQPHGAEARVSDGVEAEEELEAAADELNAPSSSIVIAIAPELLRHPQPRTPKRVHVLPVPSSRSPPDTALSTQVTPRQARRSEQRSPLKKKSANVRAASTTRSPLKEKSANIRAVPPAKSPLKSTLALPPPERSAEEKRKSPARSAQKIQKSSAQKPARESPTKRRVRDFNARFAILEQENADLRNRRTRPVARATVSAPPPLKAAAHGNIETQFSMPGAETQAAWLELPFGDAHPKSIPDVIREDSPGFVENSQPFEQGSAKHEASKRQASSRIVDDTEDEDEGELDDVDEAPESILVPSSPSKNNAVSADEQASRDPASSLIMPVAGENLLVESLPESTYNSPAPRSTTRSRDTQELASDQLLWETQQAFMFHVPSSPLIMPAPISTPRRTRSSQWKTQDSRMVRPSQATTVDESMSHSSHCTQRHMNSLELTSTPKPPPPFSSSSPTTEPLLDTTLVISSSPVLNDPILSSSSPRVQEPKTPSVLRNLRRPLRMEELVTDSLEASMPMPPGWGAGLLDLVEESEDDDGEL
jgi:hypothetical protein